MNKLKIIAVSGRSGSGSTSLCDAIVTLLQDVGWTTEYVSCMFVAHAAIGAAFSRSMHEIVRSDKRFEDCPDDVSWHEAIMDIDQAIRVGRSQNFMANALATRLLRFSESGVQIVVVDDVKFLEEKQMLERLGAKFVRLSLPGFVACEDKFSEVVLDGDMSQTNLDGETWEFQIVEKHPPDAWAKNVTQKYKEYLTDQ